MKTIQRIGFFFLFLTCGLLVFVVFSHYSAIWKDTMHLVDRIVVAGIFLALALLARFSERFQKYWLLPFA
ncbi:MAG TPA: hypothetical protein VK206_01945, partial [Anaerolineales bacterium]|nr:hypothetical protein [Anaerolineales bacterium]